MSNTSKIFLNQVTDELVIEILNRIVPILEAEKIDYFIVGAFARDLGMFAKGFRQVSDRKTEDLDLAVMVGSTADYESLIAHIAALKDFVRDENEPYRLHFKKAYKVDLLPFGDIYNEKGQVELKAKKVFVLEIPGFREVEPWTQTIETEEGISLKVSSLPGVVMLKLFAWEDRPSREKDIQDIDYILKNFYLLSVEEIIEEDDDLLELCKEEKYFDEAVSARFVGRQISRMLESSPRLKERLRNLLEANTKGFQMAKLMNFPNLEDGQRIISALYLGLLDEKQEGNNT